MRRKGSSRGTKTATPAKKENPNLDGFEAALRYDKEKAASASKKAEDDNNVLTHHTPSYKMPTEVALHGFSPNTQWAAIEFYEKVSNGIICEDYERVPPVERRRIPNFYNAAASVRSRSLTTKEANLSRQYAGGNCWIKVTFDSAEAAERAIHNSPHRIQGHWVHASYYNGTAPAVDEPILVLGKAPQQTSPSVSDVTYIGSHSLPSSFIEDHNIPQRVNATLPRSFTTSTMSQVNNQQSTDVVSQSSSTATSATATATAPEYPDLRNRLATQTQPTHPQLNPGYFTHFPDIPKTYIHPAHEAFLPQPSWLETKLKGLADAGWLPGDFIGDGIPLLENGEFDWARASFYWKFFYWIDSHFGSDFCGMKED